jgi:hypothetical protein
MDNETILRICAVLIAGILLFVNLKSVSIITYVKSLFSHKPIINVDTAKNISFIQVIESWHTLREQCESYGLKEAVKKIDEVFPLLNVEQ